MFYFTRVDLLVLMPNIPRIGISKKIESVKNDNGLKELVKKDLPEGMGAIIRTTAKSREQKKILQDLKY